MVGPGIVSYQHPDHPFSWYVSTVSLSTVNCLRVNYLPGKLFVLLPLPHGIYRTQSPPGDIKALFSLIFHVWNGQPRWLSGLMRSRVHSLWLLVDHCVLRNWDRILVRAVKGLISRAGMVSICPLLWQREVKLQQTSTSEISSDKQSPIT